MASPPPKPSIDDWYDRGARAGPAAKKYRKGACENCGAMTHQKRDCLERPRKKGAKFTNKDIQADEIIQDVPAGYDAKRDRWNGYDPAEHKKIYDEYAAIEAERQRLREEEIDKQTTTDLAAVRKVAKAGKKSDPDFGSSDEEDMDEDKYADAADAVGQKMDTKTRITVRNLRIREDTAKYLINLDPSSAYYDPKTRSMRENPNKNVSEEDVRRLFQRRWDVFLYDYRRDSPARTSYDGPVTPPLSNNCNSSQPKPPPAATTSTSTRTPPRASSSTKSSSKRKKSSATPPKSASSRNTAARSTSSPRRKSCCKVRRRTTSSTRGLGRSSRAASARRRGRSTRRMVSIACPSTRLA